ncbi:MAG: peptidyl-Lys metalloendopeptidase [Methyloprofundus sp.]|nr:MAG: peptidyl-Lys metalloendopeptidase [Methyloprofundus sp.]
MPYKYLRILITLVFISLSTPSFAQDLKLTAKLEALNTNSLNLKFILENNSNQAIQILTWNSPLEKQFSSNSFLVLHADDINTRIDYIGQLRKRATPSANDYLILSPGEAITSEINIAEFYATYHSGDYLIRYQAFVTIKAFGDPADKEQTIKLISNTLTAHQEHSITPQQKVRSARTTQSCSSSQSTTIEQARLAAHDLASDAVNVLNSTPENQRANATRYTTWFGSHQASRYAAISTNFNKILGAIENPSINFICNSSECGSGTFAFVYSRSPYDVYLCSSFWSAPLTGTDSKAGTIIHEVSHFRIVADTDDHQYGQSGTRQLALSQPDVAITNADSHEYFAENTPFLTMTSRTPDDTPTPPVPTPSPDAQTLTLDTPISGTLNIGEWVYYEVSGASSITLFNLTADLDLYIGNNTQPTENNFTCSPFQPGTTREICEVNSTETTYIGVRGYAAGSFSLLASTTDSNTNNNTLTIDTPISGALNTNEWRYFQISGATNIRLYNLSADLDLYIGNGTQPTENNFSCRPFQADTTEESCTVNSTETTYIGIRGFAAGSFTLLASSTNTSDDNNTSLTLEVPVSGTVNANEWVFYTVVDTSSIKLFNLSSDLDLYIGNSTQPSLDNYSCRPFLLSTTEETCTINTPGTTYIGIRGFTAGSYSLLASVGTSNTIDSSTSSQTLSLDTPVSSTLNRNEWAYYDVSGATSVRLYNLSADLDLYVNNAEHPTGSNFTCRPFLENTEAESCNINTTGISYLGINGYRAGSYSLVATNNSNTSSGTSIRVALSQNSFISDDVFQLNMIVTGSGDFDTYVGLIFPDGSLYTFSPPFTVNPLNTILPYHNGTQINNEEDYPILHFRLPNNIPLGHYQACSLLLHAGSPLAQENLLSSDCNAFEIK